MTLAGRLGRFASLLALTGLAACGSTVQVTGVAGGSVGASADGSGLTGPTTGAASPLPSGVPQAAGGSAAVGPATGPQASEVRTGTSTGTSGTSQAGPVAVRPQAPASGTVHVGVVYTGDDQALSTLGGNGSQSYGNERDNYTALFADLNKHGGLYGQQVRGEYYPISSSETGTSDEIQQKVCTYFTQDHKVRVVLTTLSGYIGDTLRNCLNKRGVGLVSNSLSSADARTFRSYPTYLEPTGLGIDRIAASLPSGLARSGFFTKGARVGVLTIKRAIFTRATEGILVPALRKLGFSPTVVTVADPEKDTAGAGSDTSSAVLQFQSAHVTHLLFLSPNGTIALLFTNQAESQQYRPAYGFTSQDAMEGLVEGGFIQNPSQQLAKAAGVGWQPWLDVPLQDNPIQARTAPCFAVLKKAGINYSASAARWHAALGCDSVALLREALSTVRAPLSPAAVMAGAQALGRRHLSLASFTADFRSRHDGAAAVRYFAYTPACTCFRYRGGDLAAG